MTMVDTAKIGRKGGKACLQTMTPEERSARARHANEVRWAGTKKKNGRKRKAAR